MNTRIILISILNFSMFISCGDKHTLKKDLSLFYGTTITIPPNMEVLKNGDFIVPKIYDSELKLVVYMDSMICSPCAIKRMNLWNDLLEDTKKYDGRLSFYFIFSPKKKDESKLRFAFKNTLFDYPVILDNVYEFKKKNPHLPQNSQLHTFLLDKENKVILVGNPLINIKIEEMFYKIIEEELREG